MGGFLSGSGSIGSHVVGRPRGSVGLDRSGWLRAPGVHASACDGGQREQREHQDDGGGRDGILPRLEGQGGHAGRSSPEMEEKVALALGHRHSLVQARPDDANARHEGRVHRGVGFKPVAGDPMDRQLCWAFDDVETDGAEHDGLDRALVPFHGAQAQRRTVHGGEVAFEAEAASVEQVAFAVAPLEVHGQGRVGGRRDLPAGLRGCQESHLDLKAIAEPGVLVTDLLRGNALPAQAQGDRGERNRLVREAKLSLDAGQAHYEPLPDGKRAFHDSQDRLAGELAGWPLVERPVSLPTRLEHAPLEVGQAACPDE